MNKTGSKVRLTQYCIDEYMKHFGKVPTISGKPINTEDYYDETDCDDLLTHMGDVFDGVIVIECDPIVVDGKTLDCFEVSMFEHVAEFVDNKGEVIVVQ